MSTSSYNVIGTRPPRHDGADKVTGRAILCPYAEVGMDVDKPHQLELMCADLAKRAQASS